jgi:hypothetical protein
MDKKRKRSDPSPSLSPFDAAPEGTLAVFEGGDDDPVHLLRRTKRGSPTYDLSPQAHASLEPGAKAASRRIRAAVLRLVRARGFAVEEKMGGRRGWVAVDVEAELSAEAGGPLESAKDGALAVVLDEGTGTGSSTVHVLPLSATRGTFRLSTAARAALEPGQTNQTHWTRTTVLRRVVDAQGLNKRVREKVRGVWVDVGFEEELEQQQEAFGSPFDAAGVGTLAVFEGGDDDPVHLLRRTKRGSPTYELNPRAHAALEPGGLTRKSEWARANVLEHARARGFAVEEKMGGRRGWVAVDVEAELSSSPDPFEDAAEGTLAVYEGAGDDAPVHFLPLVGAAAAAAAATAAAAGAAPRPPLYRLTASAHAALVPGKTENTRLIRATVLFHARARGFDVEEKVGGGGGGGGGGWVPVRGEE